MPEIFRKHYSYGETIPILDTHVGMTADIFEVTDKPSPTGDPYIKAVFTATAGPMKSPPMIVEPLQDHDSRVVHLTNIPVPISSVRTVDISLIFDLVNYRWTPSQETPRDNGLITFDLRLRAAFSLLGKSYTLQLDNRPCAITTTRSRTYLETVPAGGFDSVGTVDGSQREQMITTPYGRKDDRIAASTIGSVENITGQLDIEERLRQLSTKLLVRQ